MRHLTWIAALLCATALFAEDELPRVYTRWESFGLKEGLPSDKVFCVAVDQDRVWVGTDRGLALYEGGAWKVFTKTEGLAYDAVISLAVDPVTRDVWAGTMGGLSQYSAGQFRTFNQFNSGLPNDVVFGVTVENQNVWVATTTGEGRYIVREDRWEVFTPDNSPQHEPWGYAVDYNEGKVWAALWGGGALEYDVATAKWQVYRDPDGEMEVDLFRDDGIIHNITTSVSYRDGVAWMSTYFGMCNYDGQHWRGYMDHDSGLASNFVNSVHALGKVGWACTDKGLSAVHRDTNRWVTYAPANGPADAAGPWEARVYREGELLEKVPLARGLANNFVWHVDFQGDEVWVATSGGLSHGSVESPTLGAR
ncbi:MAG: regulator [Candidatus Latescibacteria bacterium]|nr:regulator [Candidatus Latescibacterota bacterium]